jgi:N-acetylneuraminate synthase
MKEVAIGNKVICDFCEPLIVAEVGANFNGDVKILKEMIIRAKEAGVDVVKFQSWRKESLMVSSLYSNKPAEITVFGHTHQEDLLDYLSLSEEQLWEVKNFCDTLGMLFSSTPVSFHDVDILVDMDVPFIKIASMDLNHLALVKYIAEKNKPVILSTGMGTVEEIAKAVETVGSTGNKQLILLHCTALYPPLDEEVNLNNIDSLREVFGCNVGYSDHTIGYSIPLAAVVKGACVIEKHYTLDKSMVGWDHAVSATPEEFRIIAE